MFEKFHLMVNGFTNPIPYEFPLPILFRIFCSSPILNEEVGRPVLFLSDCSGIQHYTTTFRGNVGKIELN